MKSQIIHNTASGMKGAIIVLSKTEGGKYIARLHTNNKYFRVIAVSKPKDHGVEAVEYIAGKAFVKGYNVVSVQDESEGENV